MAHRYFQVNGRMYGFGSSPTDHEAARLRNHLEAFVADSLVLIPSFRSGQGRRLPPIEQSSIVYEDPGDVDPPMQDAVVTFLEGKAACGGLCIYAVALHRFHGEHTTFKLDVDSTRNPVTDRLENRWHVRERRRNGKIDDWSRMLGMKG